MRPAAAAAVRPSTWANGAAETTRAHHAMYAATQPFAKASAPAADGATGSTTAAANASPSNGPTAISASALARTPSSGTRPNWSQSSGAVTTEHDTDTETAVRSFGCPG